MWMQPEAWLVRNPLTVQCDFRCCRLTTVVRVGRKMGLTEGFRNYSRSAMRLLGALNGRTHLFRFFRF
jgi:hypothetical protein